MTKKQRIIVAAVVAALAAGGVMVMASMSTDGFDGKVWRAQKGVEKNNARAGMLVGLERHLKVGMARKDVEVLLGAPDSSDAKQDVYELGRSPVGVDYESYVIEYDDSNKVTAFRLSRG